MSFDDKIKTIIYAEDEKTPEEFSLRVAETLSGLAEKPNPIKRWQRVCLSLAAVLVILVALPNLNSTMAHAMGDIPFIGEFFQAVTFRTYAVDRGNNHVYIDVPEVIPEKSDSAGAEIINEQVRAYTDQLIKQFETEVHDDGYFNLDVNWNIITDTENWFTLKLNTCLVMAGASQEVRIYHIYVPTGELLTLADLFREDFDYAGLISREIQEQMRARMAENPNEYYWLEDTTDVAGWRFDTISPDHNFYFNDEGRIVIPFDKYEVGPGSTGSPEFVLESPEIYDNLLYRP